MSTISTAILTAIITIAVTEIFRYLRKEYKNILPKKKRYKMLIVPIIKYICLTTLIVLIFLFVPFGKWFAVAVSVVSLFFAFILSKDYMLLILKRISIDVDEENLLKDKERWLDNLAHCDRSDSERINMIKSKIKDIENELKTL